MLVSEGEVASISSYGSVEGALRAKLEGVDVKLAPGKVFVQCLEQTGWKLARKSVSQIHECR
jgi:hypothetical protein